MTWLVVEFKLCLTVLSTQFGSYRAFNQREADYSLYILEPQGSHYLLIFKLKDFSRTLKFHFQGPILDGSLQHEQ